MSNNIEQIALARRVYTPYGTFSTQEEADMSTAMQEYERLYREARASARALIRQVAELRDHLDANPQIGEAVNAALAVGPEQLVAGGTMPANAYATAELLLQRLEQRLTEELAPGLSVKQAVLRLG